MAKTYPVVERSNDRITVLARSAEEAHTAATEELGSGCSIVSVDRVRSGGLGGFFATELVRLVATGRRVDQASPAGPATFASAEELLQALPQNAEFAARLKQEIAQLTAKGLAAADSRIPSAAERVALAASITRRAGEADSTPVASPVAAGGSRPVVEQAAVPPAPIAGVVDALGDGALPEFDEIRWGDEQEPDRLWRRTPREPKGRRAAIETSFIDAGDPVTVDETVDARHDEVLVWAVEDVESDEVIPEEIMMEPLSWNDEPLTEVGAGTDDLDGTDALLAQMIEAEMDFDDRPVTARANSIRTGRSIHRPEPEPGPGEVVANGAGQPNLDVSDTGGAEESADEPIEFIELAPAGGFEQPPAQALDSLAPPTAPLPVPFMAAVLNTSTWSAPTLRAFGIPDTVVERIAQHRPSDDTEWTVAFMLAVRHLCHELPEGPAVLIGPSGSNLARHLGLVSLTGEELGESTCSVASPNAGPITLRRALGGRHAHLVVGGSWHHLVTVRPDIVSAASDFDLLEALRVAEAWGATLGWANVGDRYVRIDPYLLAGRIRDLLPSPAELGGMGEPTNLPPFA